MAQTRYSAVIATRNRPEALSLSLPLLLAQSRLPEKVLIIDSSDDPEKNARYVAVCAATAHVHVEHKVSPVGAALQRNIGLAEIETEVVFFPDDDSLVHPDALEAMMRIYDLDTERRVGGVCSAEALMPPIGVLDDHAPYQMTRSDRIKAKIARTRYALEARLFRDPFFLVAERKYARQPPGPAWLAAENAITVPWMTGFRMSFRTEAIRQRSFCEELGRYALAEDIDASFGVLDRQLLVGARNAQIYHHKVPVQRANGRALGAMHILNRAYVLARSGEVDGEIRAALRRFSLYKIAQYAAAVPGGGAFARERLAGARAALAKVPALLAAPSHDLTSTYLNVRAACFTSEA